MTLTISSDAALREQIERELRTNILPFWIEHVVDPAGGFYGAVTNDLNVLNDVPRSAVLCARILWTYAAAYRRFGDPQYAHTARHACQALTQTFWDGEHGGLFWQIDPQGRPLDPRKHVYAQAFALYGLSEYHQALPDPGVLALCKELFALIETHTHDAVHGGNLECRSRSWSALDDMRLSAVDLNSRKSMNTLLHLMEAYTNLLHVWDDPALRARTKALVEVFLRHIVDPHTHHLRLFFDDDWRSLSPVISYGHDIEASWLLAETAGVLGEPGLLAQVRALAVRMAEAVRVEALEPDGGLRYEFNPEPAADPDTVGHRQWWAQAEAVVGFYNACQLSSRIEFDEAARRCWDYAMRRFVDRTHGDWFKRLDRVGAPVGSQYKAGPWECPYHHGRACLELLARLKAA